jgi:hypothetical protein
LREGAFKTAGHGKSPDGVAAMDERNPATGLHAQPGKVAKGGALKGRIGKVIEKHGLPGAKRSSCRRTIDRQAHFAPRCFLVFRSQELNLKFPDVLGCAL